MTDFKVLENYLSIDHQSYSDINLETLNHYIGSYLLNVPFENINVQNRQPIALDNKSMIEKIVDEHRGGFCYEQNRLFYQYLKAKGFEVYIVSATIKNGSSWAMEGSHMALIVILNQKKYLVDVGYADVPKAAIPVSSPDTIVDDVNGKFKVSKKDFQTFEMKKAVQKDWQIQYQFKDNPKVLDDFAKGIAFNQYNEESIFLQKLIISKAKPYGRVTMSNDHLTITKYGQKEKLRVTRQNYKQFLQRFFNITDINIQTLE